jgi:mRNA (2'-O-methyladenosine-N6-)-methyltransferase
VLKRVKEHCLVGLRGDVKRASDSHFIHANIDTDVIVEEECAMGSTRKPEEIYSMMERFCLGRKRIELFGEIHNIRDGWYQIHPIPRLTIGS